MFDYQILEHENGIDEGAPASASGLWIEDRCGVPVVTDGVNVSSMHTYAHRGKIDESTGEYALTGKDIFKKALFDNVNNIAFNGTCHDFFCMLVYVNGVLVQSGFDYSYNAFTQAFTFVDDYKGGNIMIIFS